MDTKTYQPIGFAKLANTGRLTLLEQWQEQAEQGKPAFHNAAVETIIASYGLKEGRTTFDTAIMIGRFEQALLSDVPVRKLSRQTVRHHLCPGYIGNDQTIRNALMARFAVHDRQRGKGTTRNPDFFCGFAADIWAAFAVGVTQIDLDKEVIIEQGTQTGSPAGGHDTGNAADVPVKREKANINGDTPMGVMLRFGSKAAKQLYLLRHIASRFAAAHQAGDIYIHDLDFHAQHRVHRGSGAIRYDVQAFGQHKDRFSALAMALYQASLMEEDAHAGFEEDDGVCWEITTRMG